MAQTFRLDESSTLKGRSLGMDRDNYEINIETWASSLMELEENGIEPERTHATPLSNSSLISLSTPTYYRTKAFSTSISINNLINAADPILTLVTKFRRITTAPDPVNLHHNICHEIRAFENKAQTLGYRPQLVLAARFVLCALLDELIAITLWPDLAWDKHKLIDVFHKDIWDEEQFFLILERSLQDAAAHIDLLELIYLCLRLGFEGKYRGMDRGLVELRNITDHLYSIIMHHKEEFSRGLYLPNPLLKYQKKQNKNYIHLLPPTWLMSILMAVGLLIMFTFFFIRLREFASPVAQFLQTLQMSSSVADKSNVVKT